MPVYEFEAEDGERREQFFPMADAPQIGSWVELEGKAFRRVIVAPQLADSKGQTSYRLHSNACPNERMVNRWEREAVAKGLPMPARAPKYDEVGRAVFRSDKELRDYCKRDGRYDVGNPREVAQETVRRTHEHRTAQLAQVAANEKVINMPEVK